MDHAKINDYRPLPEGPHQFSLDFMESFGVIKLKDEDGSVIIGALSDPDHELLQKLRFFLAKPLRFVLVEKQDFAEYLSKHAGGGLENHSPEETDDQNYLDRLANDAPIINMVNSVLLEGLRLGASDIHIEGRTESVEVRFRIDGVLHLGRELPKNALPGLSSRIKIMANLNIIERRLPQDGKMTAQVGQDSVEFRVSIIPTVEGESIVLRLFNKRESVKSLDELGFSPSDLTELRRIAHLPNGLILVTGPTGSGKTTTLSAMLRELNSPELKIITVEDPVENNIPGLCQVQTNEEIGLTFDSILRRLLRQDPDIMMVGEIRDKKTADLALRSAMTGHMVWATIHTNDAVSTIHRLVNMGVDHYLLPGVLRGVLAQRLVRKICRHCLQSRGPETWEKDLFEAHGKKIDRLFKGVGCPRCAHSGYSGRTVVGELLVLDEEMNDMILRDAKKSEIQNYWKKTGGKSLIDHGFQLAAEGVTSMSEIQKTLFFN